MQTNTKTLRVEACAETQKALAMVFINDQPFGGVYQPLQGLIRGTIFPSLDKPFLCAKCKN